MKSPEGRTPTHAQAELLILMEAQFAQLLPDAAALPAWLDGMAALADRYLAAGGTLDELQARFNDEDTPLGGRFFFSQKGPL